MKKIIFITIILGIHLVGFSTVMGPIRIEIIGFDNMNKTIYLTRTNFAECDCETDLFKYYIESDSLEIITHWVERSKFRLHKQDVLKEKGLDKINEIKKSPTGTSFYSFKWLPKTNFYSPVIMKDTVNCPFQVLINEKGYEFVQCYSQDKKPKISEYLVNDSVGFIHIRYRGDCYEGNMRDQLILVLKNGGILTSRLLISS